MKTDKLPEIIHAGRLATLCNLSSRRLYQLAEQKKIPSPTDGNFSTAETITALFAFYQRGDGGLTDAKTRLANEQTELTEIKKLHLAGELVFRSDVQRLWDAAIIVLRQKITEADIPEKAKQDLVRDLQSIDGADYSPTKPATTE